LEGGADCRAMIENDQYFVHPMAITGSAFFLGLP
jgi:hypothetical protein